MGKKMIFAGLCLVVSMPVWAADDVLMLVYREVEPGAGPFISRALVSENYVRFDYGELGSEFVLFNRKEQAIYSINPAAKTVMVISKRDVLKESPIKLDMKEEHVSTAKMNQGMEIKHMRYFANKNRCSDIFTVEGLMPDASKALKNFYVVLAGEHAQTMDMIPSDILDACDLALNIFSPKGHYQTGFPIREILYTGREKLLLDYDAHYQVDKSWYDIPENYQQYSPAQVRGSEIDA